MRRKTTPRRRTRWPHAGDLHGREGMRSWGCSPSYWGSDPFGGVGNYLPSIPALISPRCPACPSLPLRVPDLPIPCPSCACPSLPQQDLCLSQPIQALPVPLLPVPAIPGQGGHTTVLAGGFDLPPCTLAASPQPPLPQDRSPAPSLPLRAHRCPEWVSAQLHREPPSPSIIPTRLMRSTHR